MRTFTQIARDLKPTSLHERPPANR